MDQLDLFYPAAPGYKAEGPSHEAAIGVQSKAETLRRRILGVLKFNNGAYTADEIAEFMGEPVLNVRPRFSELYASGEIFDTGIRRKNLSGATALVWRAR